VHHVSPVHVCVPLCVVFSAPRVLQVAVVDAAGTVVPTASDVVTFTVSGPATLVGTANGDPSCLVNNLSPSRPAFHGLVLGVLTSGDQTGPVRVGAVEVAAGWCWCCWCWCWCW
jgi:hypothetical protein